MSTNELISSAATPRRRRIYVNIDEIVNGYLISGGGAYSERRFVATIDEISAVVVKLIEDNKDDS